MRPGAPLALALGVLLGPPARAQLRFEPPAIDFGDRGQNERPETTVILRNLGAAPLVVREIKKSCDCIQVFPPRLEAPIPPQGTVPLRVSMGSGRAMGRLDKRISILTQGGAQPEIGIPVSMRVFDGFEMEPRGEVKFEGVVGGALERATVDVRPGRGGAAAARLEVKAIRGLFNRPSGRHLRASVATAGLGQRLTVELDPGHPEGPISAEVELLLNGKTLIIPVTGEMFAWIKVSPNYINFSRAIEDQPASTVREVLLTSTDSTPWKLIDTRWQPTRPGDRSVRLEFKAEPVPADGSPPRAWRLTCRAIRGEGKEGSFFGTVTVRTDHPKKPELVLRYGGFFVEPAKGGAGRR